MYLSCITDYANDLFRKCRELEALIAVLGATTEVFPETKTGHDTF